MELADVRVYQRQLLLHVLTHHGESTAAEALELMGNIALDQGAPRDAILVSTAAVSGLLRELHSNLLVVRGENRGDTRNGRMVATWSVTDAGRIDTRPVPGAVGGNAVQVREAPAVQAVDERRSRGGLTLPQLMGLLTIEFDAMLSEMDREHQQAQERARREFEGFRQRALRVWGVSEASA
ncbi:hypothetical protein [Stenotrophomonas sp. SY1]|uniref:hypothetical protein n=1 Tax=Stenotrophomonas sp. SY1 TaxID=477235 RepID=UPI001E4D564C|nr:hypothetical protein [Stenotrophomonas sp. SY1]MCD9086221.1 hypothetical protein [Stenotrophomonas sp. SY1]